MNSDQLYDSDRSLEWKMRDQVEKIRAAAAVRGSEHAQTTDSALATLLTLNHRQLTRLRLDIFPTAPPARDPSIVDSHLDVCLLKTSSAAASATVMRADLLVGLRRLLEAAGETEISGVEMGVAIDEYESALLRLSTAIGSVESKIREARVRRGLGPL